MVEMPKYLEKLVAFDTFPLNERGVTQAQRRYRLPVAIGISKLQILKPYQWLAKLEMMHACNIRVGLRSS